MLTRDKLEYQKRLRFLREAKAKTASEKLKLATKAEESDLTKPMVTLGDEENRVPVRGETPKEYNETPKTGEESLLKDPVDAGAKKEKKKTKTYHKYMIYMNVSDNVSVSLMALGSRIRTTIQRYRSAIKVSSARWILF